MRYYTGCYFLLFAFLACGSTDKPREFSTVTKDSVVNLVADSDGSFPRIETGNTTPAQLLAYASTLQGIPYKYGSIDPKQGFDCSGFITYVFSHFDIAVPRRSVDFTNVDREIPLREAKTGDLVLFTGTDSTIRVVGHMGIVIANPGEEVKFMHSTSGKAYGVTITPLNTYYMGRYMKMVRIFPQNDK